MKVAVVGATGMVGEMMRRVLTERAFPITEFLAVASARSVGKEVRFNDKIYQVISMEEAVAARPDIALFSAGGSVSRAWAPRFAEVGTVVIDNSSAWRMDADRPLVVPELNADILTKNDKIIANPNCSTIQLVVALNLLHQRYKARRIVVSTYQSVTGTGVKAVSQLMNERAGVVGEQAYQHPIDLNCLPQIDVFTDSGYTKEELKMTHETVKIMRDPLIRLTATTVRVPVMGGHSEAVNVEFEEEFDLAELRALLAKTPGVVVQDEPKAGVYPMPINSHNRDEVFVGRLRRDETQPRTLNMWVVADNLRKGAATNAVQIAEYLVEKGLVGV